MFNRTHVTIHSRWSRFTQQSYIILQNREKVSAYLTDYLEYCRTAREEYEKNPPLGVVRLRQLMAESCRDLSFQKYGRC